MAVIEVSEKGIMEGLERRFVNSRLKCLLQRHFEIKVYSKMLLSNGLEAYDGMILDAGCGAGYGLELINERFRPRELYGIDIDPLEVELSRKREGTARISVQDLANTSFKSSFFDVIFAFTILHHMPHWKRGLKEIHRILRPGGLLLLNEHNRCSLDIMELLLGVKHPEQGRFTWKELESSVEEAGLEIIDKSIFFGLFGFFLCRKGLTAG
ncbi:MAG: class I SAM-dependent methyltransferase [Candidatus Methanofastidiosa archaeon]|nr:class I SAM-dependent methyltransferase [Candidatus Methanofastidiosa archaeon]